MSAARQPVRILPGNERDRPYWGHPYTGSNGQRYVERAAGPDDGSPQHTPPSDLERCASCYVGQAHTEAYHALMLAEHATMARGAVVRAPVCDRCGATNTHGEGQRDRCSSCGSDRGPRYIPCGDDRCPDCGRWPEQCRCDAARTVCPEEGY